MSGGAVLSSMRRVDKGSYRNSDQYVENLKVLLSCSLIAKVKV